MWRLNIALLLLSTGQIWAQENATAYEALRVVGTQLGRGALNHIVSITGVNRSSRPVGTIYIGANRGTVKRTEGMFAGATMEDVENDYDQGERSGVISGVKKSIKHAFHRTQDEARGMFERVKRSFSDFINRE